jgi:hypothetical protein
VLFTDWCQQRDIIVWAVVPQLAQLHYLSNRGVKNFLLYDQPEADAVDLSPIFGSIDNVLSLNCVNTSMCVLTKAVYTHTYLPIVPHTPQYRIHSRAMGAQPTVVWPVFDGDCTRCMWEKLIGHMSPFMADMHDVFRLKIVLSGGSIPAALLREFQVWRRRYRNVSLHTQRSVLWRELHYHGADLMFWPSTVENALLRGLHAYANEVPIVGIMANPMSDLLLANPHLTVPIADTDCDMFGYVEPFPSDIIYSSLLSRLLSVVQLPCVLAEASENVGKFMAARQKAFSAAMLKLFK